MTAAAASAAQGVTVVADVEPMPAVSGIATRPLRASRRFSRSGRVHASVLSRPGRAPLLEVAVASERRTVEVPELSASCQLVPDDEGNVLVCGQTSGALWVQRVAADGSACVVYRSQARALSLLAGRPDRSPRAVERFADGVTSVVELRPDGARALARVPGIAVGGVWMDTAQELLALNVVEEGRGCAAVLVDLRSGTAESLLSISRGSDDRVVDFLPQQGLVVVETDASGERRVGYGRPGASPVTFPPALSAPGPVAYLATEPDGSAIAVADETGAMSRLRLVSTHDGRGTDLPLPPLVVTGMGSLRGGRLRLPVSTPTHGDTLLEVDADGYRLEDVPDPAAAHVTVSRVPGAAGRLEALLLGDAATAEHVVVALHGGPRDAWRARYDPLLAALAAAGVAVVAPNVRGSTGYGRAHERAIHGAWGGPDLDDVIAVGRAVSRWRAGGTRPPIVLGTSYGAFLAVLAAAAAPQEWSACVALAPFLSGRGVRSRGGAAAELVRRLGGETSPDLREVAPAVAVPVLLVHGGDDAIVPAADSAVLLDALRRHGGTAWRHLVPGAGHDLTGGPGGAEVLALVTSFCTRDHERR